MDASRVGFRGIKGSLEILWFTQVVSLAGRSSEKLVMGEGEMTGVYDLGRGRRTFGGVSYCRGLGREGRCMTWDAVDAHSEPYANASFYTL
eukprot:1139547-Pelagomonas_calceolata.AAC.16